MGWEIPRPFLIEVSNVFAKKHGEWIVYLVVVTAMVKCQQFHTLLCILNVLKH